MTLKNSAKTSQIFLILGHRGPPELVERLNEIGFRKDSQCEFLGRTPLGGPMLVRLGPMVIALRENEADCLVVAPV